jgi:glycosyltransferase involved in cell wall biosynthesis
VRGFARRYARMALAGLVSPPRCRPGAEIACWHLRLAPVAALLSRRVGRPFRVFLHGVEAWGGLSPRVRWAMGRAGFVGANSEYTLRRFRAAHPRFAGLPGAVYPLGLSGELGDPSAGRLPAALAGRPFLLCVTRLAETYKGEETLLRAFAAARRRHPRLALVLVGSGPGLARLREAAAALGLSDAALFAGSVPDADLAALYRECLAFALLSEGEGFGLVFAEAMAHGKPCLATDADAACELVRHGETGLLVPPRDEAAAAAALGRLLGEPGLAARLGAAARREVEARLLPSHFRARMAAFMGIQKEVGEV